MFSCSSLSKCIALTAICCAARAVAASDPGPPAGPKDFAYSRGVEISGQAALYSFQVPDDVYRIATRSDLGDLRIFNSEGAAAPHELSRVDASIEKSIVAAAIPFFPIEGSLPSGLGSNDIEVSQDASGKMLRVWIAGSQPKKEGGRSSYLLDLRNFKRQLVAFEIQSEDITPNKIVDVQIDGSPDLKDWRSVAASGVLARLNYLGQEVIQNRFEFSSGGAQFLRLSFPDDDKISIMSIKGEFLNSERKAPVESWLPLQSSRDPKLPTTFFFDSEGFFPARSVRVTLPQLNTFVRIRLSSKPTLEAAWVPRWNGTVYRLATKGGELGSAPQILGNGTSDRYWRLEVEGKDSQLGMGGPSLVLGWVPHEVYFIAQGQPPFQLAYGNARVAAADFGVAQLAAASAGQGIAAEAAILGEPREVGGMASRVLPKVEEPLPWKKWTLWAVLVGFLAVVGVMALRLAKDLKNSN